MQQERVNHSPALRMPAGPAGEYHRVSHRGGRSSMNEIQQPFLASNTRQ